MVFLYEIQKTGRFIVRIKLLLQSFQCCSKLRRVLTSAGIIRGDLRSLQREVNCCYYSISILFNALHSNMNALNKICLLSSSRNFLLRDMTNAWSRTLSRKLKRAVWVSEAVRYFVGFKITGSWDLPSLTSARKHFPWLCAQTLIEKLFQLSVVHLIQTRAPKL